MKYGYYSWQLPSPRAGCRFRTRQGSVRQMQNKEMRSHPGEGPGHGKFLSSPWFLSSASSYVRNRNKARETLEGGSCSEGKMLCAANSLSKGPSALAEATHAVLG